ncbi:Dabb family protein [Rhodococcus sp. F64268]|uniref:Dabb family protein n=1 Tax=Rhodococcus sp. F64268 TaxID=2926402 RepID=UPI001FF26ADE|nr:Dabb family protein [Rhodococcus sp. F64268]MCK0089238.1 Dabb family protein [Rhodococcus sp. F64268]
MASVSAINLFSLRPGVTAEQFEQFSQELDRPTCLAFDEVEEFEVFLVEKAAGQSMDVIEIMTVTSWSDWVAVRDGAPELEPVVKKFDELVDTSTVTTYFTRRSPLIQEK